MLNTKRLLALSMISIAGVAIPVSVRCADLGNGWEPTALELLQVPKYCQQQFLSKHDGKVMSKLFSGCSRVNHLCPGLILINRAEKHSIPKGERKRILRQAKNEIDYSSSQLTNNCNVKADIESAQMRIRFLEKVLP